MVSVPRPVGRWMVGCAVGAAVGLAAGSVKSAEFALLPGDKAVGSVQEYVVQSGDLLADLARKFDVGYTEMLAANPGVDPWVPPAGRKILIPTLFILPDAPRQGIVINLGERRLYYFPPGGGRVVTYPIGIGATGFDTPHSVTKVVAKVADPTWVPPPSIRAEQPDLPAAIGPGPDNPLGAYEFRLGWKNYLIHGTNKPDGVGRNVSHGCIHLYPEDIEALFRQAPIGTPVRVIDQEGAVAWVGDRLYVETHPSKAQADAIDVEQPMPAEPLAGWRERVAAATGDNGQAVDWNAVDQAAARRAGLPIAVAIGQPGAVQMSAAPPAPLATPLANPVAPPAKAAAPVAESLTPIFNTLEPPQAASAALPLPAAPPPIGAPLAPPTPLWPPPAADAAQSPPDAVGAAGDHIFDNEAARARWFGRPDPGTGGQPAPAADPTDPNAAYNATFTAPGAYPTAAPDRPTWDRGYR